MDMHFPYSNSPLQYKIKIVLLSCILFRRKNIPLHLKQFSYKQND